MQVGAQRSAGEVRFPHPRGELCNPAGGMDGDRLEHIDQISVGVEAVQVEEYLDLEFAEGQSIPLLGLTGDL